MPLFVDCNKGLGIRADCVFILGRKVFVAVFLMKGYRHRASVFVLKLVPAALMDPVPSCDG